MAQMAAGKFRYRGINRKAALSSTGQTMTRERRSYEDYYASVRDINLKFLGGRRLLTPRSLEEIQPRKKEQTARIQAHRDWQKLVDERVKAEQDYTNAISTFEHGRTASVQKFADQHKPRHCASKKASYAASYVEMFKMPQQRGDDSQRLALVQTV